jgi:[ribosomal protein S5]-alanine N-acetyltransferase
MPLAIPDRIETPRLTLQRLRYEDAEEIFYAYASKPEATQYVAWPTHQSIQETRSYLNYVIPQWEKGVDYSFSARLKETNRLVGSFGIVNDQGKVQFGYILSPTQWNRGYATEMCSAVVSMLMQLSDIHRIWTLVDADNTASVKVLMKAGLKEEARLQKWYRFINQDNQPKDCILFRL